jgi:hypothetical protein
VTDIHQTLSKIKSDFAPTESAREILGLLKGDECTTDHDRCVALTGLCEALLCRIENLEISDRCTQATLDFHGLSSQPQSFSP